MRRKNHEVGINNTDNVDNTDDVDKTERILPSSEDTDDYDPHKHRNRPKPTS